MDKIQAFYEREDVMSLDFDDVNGAASRANSLRYAMAMAPGDAGGQLVPWPLM